MSVGKKFTPPAENKKLRLDINSHVLEELELYVECGKEEYDWLTVDIVVEQLLEDALKKDRSFRSWLKQRKKAKKAQQTEPSIPEMPQHTDHHQQGYAQQ